MSYLERVFRATEEENRRAILDALPFALGGTLLDLGTHEGAFTTRVADRVAAEETFGLELLERHAERARAQGINVTCADLDEGFPFESDRFDVVHANQVIEHVRRTDAFLTEIRRVLAPRGVACISTNNLASWHNVLSLALGLQPAPMHVSDEVVVGNPINPEQGKRHADEGRVHLRLFTGRALSELCEHHGLRPVALRTAGYYPLPPVLARRALKLDPTHGAFLVALLKRR